MVQGPMEGDESAGTVRPNLSRLSGACSKSWLQLQRTCICFGRALIIALGGLP